MSSNRWTNEFLDSMRTVTDPPADDAVRELFEQGEVGAVNKLMSDMLKNDQLVPEDFPPCIQSYIEKSERLPDWANENKIKQAEDFFARNGMTIGMTLLFSSLPMCYACAKGVQVLHLTARLETDAKRRVAETSQMIIHIMVPGGLAPTGRGVTEAQKVRLMHAAVRHLILESGQWDSNWGAPINQEDLAGTLLSFSYLPIASLEKLGVKVLPEEADAYRHAWNIVGHIMGVRSDLLPDTMDDAKELVELISRRNFEISQAGREMTAALIEMVDETLPGSIFKGFPATMIRFLNGDQVADIVGVANEDWTRKLVGPIGRIFGRIEGEADHSRILAAVSEHFGRAFTEAFSWIDRGGHRAPFEIPHVLRQQWNLKPHPGASQ
ncbi:MAG: oxygenase MpaB family protein [Acidobacteriota bacterium]